MRSYKCLSKNVFSQNDYSIVPIRDSDKYEILEWRNSQIDILRQKTVITKDQQDLYFNTTVSSLFEQDKPGQLLWSFLHNGNLIGYGGLVHIDWNALHGEISFLLCNERNNDISIFKKDWKNFVSIIEDIAFNELNFYKIHTYAYNIRDYYFDVLYERDFVKEGQLKGHIMVQNKRTDVLILSKFNVK